MTNWENYREISLTPFTVSWPPVSGLEVGEHGAADVHGVGALAHHVRVGAEQLRHRPQRRVVVQRRGGVLGQGAGRRHVLRALRPGPGSQSEASTVVLQKVASELHPKVRNHGEGPY